MARLEGRVKKLEDVSGPKWPTFVLDLCTKTPLGEEGPTVEETYKYVEGQVVEELRKRGWTGPANNYPGRIVIVHDWGICSVGKGDGCS
jgi:hypothetical protein